jgi:hypothetical protein
VMDGYYECSGFFGSLFCSPNVSSLLDRCVRAVEAILNYLFCRHTGDVGLLVTFK